MKLARSWSVALVGLQATMVEVEACFGPGLPGTTLVGMGDTAVREAKERCRAAVASSGQSWPSQMVTINLSPASVPKQGAHYDLPIVAAVLAANGVVGRAGLEETVLLGELGLDGRVRTVRGVLPSLLAARQEGFRRAVVPAAVVREARLVEGLTVVGVRHLGDVIALLRGEEVDEVSSPPPEELEWGRPKDLADVVGQREAKWALEVAAAGGHHLSLVGPPGVGKTLLAERLVGLLPDLTTEESLEVSAIHSLTGRSLERLIRRPPYANPHHTASVAALVGGGSRIAVPGAISRAHRGVLFLDEVAEFQVRALESLRQPLESGEVVHHRSNAETRYPARFQLVTAANPCPCGWAETDGGVNCTCAPMAIRRYRERMSGPILDRIDIQLRLAPMKQSYLRKARQMPEEPTATVADRVRLARERQRHRLARFHLSTNAEVPGPMLRRELPLPDGIELVERAVRLGQLSARGVDKVLRIAWSLADIAGAAVPTKTHLHSALGMRRGEILETVHA